MQKKIRAVCLLFLLACAAGLSAAPLRFFSPGDPLLDDIRYVARESGTGLSAFTPPLSSHEVRLILENINEAKLSPPGRAAFRRIWDALEARPLFAQGPLGVDGSLQTALEGRVRSNERIPWSKGIHHSPVFFKPALGLHFSEYVSLQVEPGLGVDPYFYEEKNQNWNSNVPFPFERLDANSPLRAWGAAGGPWWNFQIGRDRLSFGTGRTGNLALSDNPDFYDFGRLSFFVSDFKYTIFAGQFPLDSSQIIATAFKTAGGESYTATTNRYLYMHRMDMRFFKKLSIGLSEGLMVSNSPLELRYLSPAMIFHSFFPWNDYPAWVQYDASGKALAGDNRPTGSLLSAEIEWAVMPSLSIYGQVLMNELAFFNEVQNWSDNLAPNAFGYMAGLAFARAAGEWQSDWFAEFVYTDPFLYMLSSPFSSFVSMRRLSETADKPLRYQWIGHPAGRDVIMAALGADWSRHFDASGSINRLGFSAGLTFVRSGEHGILWDWYKGKRAFDEQTPSGTPENRFSGSLGVSLTCFRGLELSLYTAGTLLLDAAHQSGGREEGLELGLSAVWRAPAKGGR